MSEITVRGAKLKDFDEILPLFQQLHPKESLDKKDVKKFYKEMISSDKHFAWVAIFNNQIVGYIDVVFRTYHFSFGFTARIETIIVEEKHRRMKSASKLFEKCEDKAKKEGCKIIELDCGFHRKGAHKFYESHNYSKRGYLFWKHL